MRLLMFILGWSIAFVSCNSTSSSFDQRRIIDLNGNWEISKTNSFDVIPDYFESEIVVPGLVDMAIPSLDSDIKYDNGVYWYRKKFSIDQEIPELVYLKINKVKYHAKIFMNGSFVDEQLYCFTGREIDIRDFVNDKGIENELVIGVGTKYNIPDTIMWGQDFEKLTYIPGLYDDVEIILTGNEYISNIQTVPDINQNQVRVKAYIKNYDHNTDNYRLLYEVRELGSGHLVAEGESLEDDFIIPIYDCKLWTPEDPFLYELKLSTGVDNVTVRFGMRSFSFDTEANVALLNGKPYYMRGTNVCIFRFFEDPERGSLPWESNWTIKLHEQFKNMNWNTIRYCIGPPPKRWYEVADSLGFLIQNEYPFWTGANPENVNKFYPGLTAEHLSNEYRDWMSEYWNHPSVVIWDAQNESVTDITAKAINSVRDLDLSNRPWENGWSTPASITDPMEAHPYLFNRYRIQGAPSNRGALADFFDGDPLIPGNSASDRMPSKDGKNYENPIIINEYAWLWLNRDGTTTTLTDRVYEVAFGQTELNSDERIYHYNRNLGMLTEYWRAHRLCAGVLHFCGLAYSRPENPRGQTSDHFVDIKNLEYEPLFEKYVKPSFCPIGLMINFWDNNIAAKSTLEFEVYCINDLEQDFGGILSLKLLRNDKTILMQTENIGIPGFQRIVDDFKLEVPEEVGHYKLIAEIEYRGDVVKSIREFSVN